MSAQFAPLPPSRWTGTASCDCLTHLCTRSAGVLCNCINHALISEGEEVMGLLLGDIQDNGNGSNVTNIWRALPQIRNDRRKVRVSFTCLYTRLFRCAPAVLKYASCAIRAQIIGLSRSVLAQDRVECGGEQMADVAKQAEQISQQTGRLTRVVGWYHSHPHITVLPSHIDIATQVRIPDLNSYAAPRANLRLPCFPR